MDIALHVRRRSGQNQAWVFRALRYGPDYPGLAGRELTRSDTGR